MSRKNCNCALCTGIAVKDAAAKVASPVNGDVLPHLTNLFAGLALACEEEGLPRERAEEVLEQMRSYMRMRLAAISAENGEAVH